MAQILDTSGLTIGVYDADRPPVVRTDTNTINLVLHDDEVLALVAGISRAGADYREIVLVIEADEITYPARALTDEIHALALNEYKSHEERLLEIEKLTRRRP